MNCLTVRNLISAYIDCELAPEQKREVRQHLFNCPECNQEYNQLLTIKNCLENSRQEDPEFNPLEALYARIETEKMAFIAQNDKFYWGSRILMMAACLFAFFFSTFMLFPMKYQSSNIAQEKFFSNSTSSTVDQNISIDQPVTVYQASLVLP